MKKLLTSVWFVTILGMVLFLVTIVVFWKPAEAPAAAAQGAGGTNATATAGSTNLHAAPEEVVAKPIVSALPPSAKAQAGEPGSLSFNNPELQELRTELQQEKAALLDYERQLRELDARLKFEKTQLSGITQEVWQAKAALEAALIRERTIMDSAETNQLRGISKVLTNMAPTNAVALLRERPSDEAAMILHLMEYKQQAAILESFGTNANDLTKVTEILDKIRTLAPKPQLPTKK